MKRRVLTQALLAVKRSVHPVSLLQVNCEMITMVDSVPELQEPRLGRVEIISVLQRHHPLNKRENRGTVRLAGLQKGLMQGYP